MEQQQEQHSFNYDEGSDDDGDDMIVRYGTPEGTDNEDSDWTPASPSTFDEQKSNSEEENEVEILDNDISENSEAGMFV